MIKRARCFSFVLFLFVFVFLTLLSVLFNVANVQAQENVNSGDEDITDEEINRILFPDFEEQIIASSKPVKYSFFSKIGDAYNQGIEIIVERVKSVTGFVVKITGMAGGSDDTRTWIINSGFESSSSSWLSEGVVEFTSLYTPTDPDVSPYSGTKFAALKYCSTCYAKPSLKQTINTITSDSLAGEYELCAYGVNLGGASRGHICFNGKCTATSATAGVGKWTQYCVTNSVAKGSTINIELNAFDKTHYFAWDAVTITKKETPTPSPPPSEEPPVYNEVCTDSDATALDGGIYTYGCASLSGGPVASSKCDVCSTTNTVAETTCDGKSIKTNNVLCPNSGACKNGACVKAPKEGGESACESLVSLGTCVMNVDCYWDEEDNTCKDYIDTEEFRKSLCSDPDGGINPTLEAKSYGFVLGSIPRIRESQSDSCYTNLNTGLNEIEEGYCSDSTNYGYFKIITLPCESGCAVGAGACTPIEPEPTCTDSDGGRNYFERGLAISGIGGDNIVNEDSCLPVESSPGDQTHVKEYFCNADKTLGFEEKPCEFGCAFGRCIEEIESECSLDTDNGDFYEKGISELVDYIFVPESTSSFAGGRDIDVVVLSSTEIHFFSEDLRVGEILNLVLNEEILVNPHLVNPPEIDGLPVNAYIEVVEINFVESNSRENYVKLKIRLNTEDACSDENNLKEAVCVPSESHDIDVTDTFCGNGCSEGACIPETFESYYIPWKRYPFNLNFENWQFASVNDEGSISANWDLGKITFDASGNSFGIFNKRDEPLPFSNKDSILTLVKYNLNYYDKISNIRHRLRYGSPQFGFTYLTVLSDNHPPKENGFLTIPSARGIGALALDLQTFDKIGKSGLDEVRIMQVILNPSRKSLVKEYNLRENSYNGNIFPGDCQNGGKIIPSYVPGVGVLIELQDCSQGYAWAGGVGNDMGTLNKGFYKIEFAVSSDAYSNEIPQFRLRAMSNNNEYIWMTTINPKTESTGLMVQSDYDENNIFPRTYEMYFYMPEDMKIAMYFDVINFNDLNNPGKGIYDMNAIVGLHNVKVYKYDVTFEDLIPFITSDSNIVVTENTLSNPINLVQLDEENNVNSQLLDIGDYSYGLASQLVFAFSQANDAELSKFATSGAYRVELEKDGLLIDDFSLDAYQTDYYVLDLENGDYDINVKQCEGYQQIFDNAELDTSFTWDGYYPASLDFISTQQSVSACDINEINCQLSQQVFAQLQSACSTSIGRVELSVDLSGAINNP